MLDREQMRVARRRLILIVFALAAAGTVWRALFWTNNELNALMFIGLPLVLAIVLAYEPPAESTTGAVARAITLLLLLAAILGFEGMACVIMSAPLFYLVGLMFTVPIDRYRRRKNGSNGLNVFTILPLALLSLEGVFPFTSLDRSEVVTAAAVVDATPAEVEASLASTPEFDQPLPRFLTLGFAHPVASFGSGLKPGSTRLIEFSKPRRAYLEMEVVSSKPGEVVFETVADTTRQGSWAKLRSSTVRWVPTASGDTLVTWTVDYERRLDPAFYFGPLQRYGMSKMGEYLIATVATP